MKHIKDNLSERTMAATLFSQGFFKADKTGELEAYFISQTK